MKESLQIEFAKTNNHNCNKKKNEVNSNIVDDVVDVDNDKHCDDDDSGRQSKNNMDNNAQSRKKACLDRYDSSESSDSGVALLSGSSSNCDLSDPYSPSNSSSISSGFYTEDNECTKMSPTTDTEKSNLTSWLSFINFISNEQKPFDDNFSCTNPELIQTSDITSTKNKNKKAEKSFEGHTENATEEDGDDEDDDDGDDCDDDDDDNETEDDKDNRETDNDHHDSNNNSSRIVFKAKNKLKSSLPLATKLPPTLIVQKQRKPLPLSAMEQKQKQKQQDSFKETDKHQKLLQQHKPRHKLNSQYEKFSGSDFCLWKDCGKRFQSSSEFLDHLQANHITSQAGEEQFICKWTNCKVYDKPSCSKSWLERHVLSHAGKRPFKCIVDGCGAVFSTQILLEKHVNSHFNNVQSCVSNQSVSNGSSISSNFSNNSGSSSSGGNAKARNNATKTTLHSTMSSSSSLLFHNNNSQIENNKTTNSCSSATGAAGNTNAAYKSLNLPISCNQQFIGQSLAVTASTSKCSKKNHKRTKSKRQSSAGQGGRSFDYFDDRIMDVVNRQLLVNYYPLKQNKRRGRKDAYANYNHETEVDCIVNDESSDDKDSFNVDDKKHNNNDLIKLTSFVKGQMIDSNGTKTYLLKWIPENILPDEWVVEHQMESYRTISKQAYRSLLRTNSQLIVPTAVRTNERLSRVRSSASSCGSATSITTDGFATALTALSETASSVLSSSASSSASSPSSFISIASTPVSLSPIFSSSASSTSSSWRRKYPKRHKIS